MVYKLHGVGMSTCTQRVLIAAQEAGIQDQVELVPVDFAKGEHKSDAFIKMQPFGQVPVLEDTENGVIMHECVKSNHYYMMK